MITKHNRVLHGASILAICAAAPAVAQTVPINAGVLLANPLATATTDVISGGVTATGAAPTAVIDNLSNGEAAQVSETSTAASLTNGGTFAITADANGTGTATASVGNVAPDVAATGAYQSALTQKHLLGDVEGATWDASATLVNTGTTRVRAVATSSDGDASATVIGGVAQTASVETKGRTATALMDNRGTTEVSAAASGAGTITASVGVGGETGAPAIRQFVFSAKSPDVATVDRGTILNSGTIALSASATPLVAAAPSATAKLTGGVVQQIQATGRGNSTLTATVDNSRTINFNVTAGVGSGSALTAKAYATEVLTQRVQANGGGLASDPVTGWNDTATLALNNTGTISLTTNAKAVSSASSLIGVKSIPADFGNYGAMYGSTYGSGPGLNQGYQNFAGASPILSEHGVISQRGQTNGWGDDLSDLAFTNAAGGAITVTASAAATNPAGDADALNVAGGLIVQKTQANGTGNDTARAALTNAGSLTMTLGAASTATGGNATAVSALANAIMQGAEVTGPTKYVIDGAAQTYGYYVNIGQLAFTNGATGVVDLRSSATAAATGGNGEAHAYVDPGLLQTGQVDGGTPQATFDNRNRFNVAATSQATGTGAFASAGTANLVLDAAFPVDEGRLPTAHDVTGVRQVLVGKATDARFTNSGDFGVAATSTATGTTIGAIALASARGYTVTGEPVGVTANNTGNLTVGATAAAANAGIGAPRLAYGLATGMGFYANYEALPAIPELAEGGESGQGGHPAGDVTEAPTAPTYALTGTVTNGAAGNIVVTARATGDAALPTGEFLLPDSIVTGQTLAVGARAIGVEFVSASNNIVLLNNGTIEANALFSGATARAATGVLVSDYENSWGVQSGPDDVFTLNNLGGTIRARISMDSGATYKHGTAIDTSAAPNRTVINLEAAGGRKGLVYGNIDISAVDQINVRNGETALDGVINPGGPAEGSLAIRSGGTLYLMNQPHGAVSTTGTPTVNTAYDGPAGAVVNSFTVESGGKLALQLPSFPTAPGTYPTVVANAVTLGATAALEVRRSSWNGLYANSYYFDNVIKAPTAAALSGTFAASLVAFSAPTPLLTVKALYNTDVGGGDVDLKIDRVAFDAVAGLTQNQKAAGGGIERVYSPTRTGAFGALLGNLFLLDDAGYRDALNQLSGDQYAGYIHGLRNHGLQVNTLVSSQLDCALAQNGLDSCGERDGVARIWGQAQYDDLSVDTDVNAPRHEAQSWSLLLGADYSVGSFTFGAFGGYRESNVKFSRNNGTVDADGWQLGLMAAYDTGRFYGRVVGSYSDMKGKSRRSISILTTAGTIDGKPDVTVTSVHGEIGARLPVSGSWLTPFVGVDYAHLKLKAFTESGVPGANLAFNDQSEDQTSLLAGVKWATSIGGIVPEAKLAWRHDFNNRVFGVTARYVDAPVGSDFRVYSPLSAENSVLAGVSLSASLGERFSARIGYQGGFSSEVNDHSVYGSLVFRFGGSR